MTKRASNGNLLLEQYIELANITIESGNGFRYALVDQKAQFEVEIEDQASDDTYNYAYPNPASSVLNLVIAQDVERAVTENSDHPVIFYFEHFVLVFTILFFLNFRFFVNVNMKLLSATVYSFLV